MTIMERAKTLEQLRTFVAVAERLHVTQAAGALNMTQSIGSRRGSMGVTHQGQRLAPS